MRTRTGARKYLDIIAIACKLFRLPFFKSGIIQILGDENGNAVIDNFTPFCELVEQLIISDNYYNKVDTVAEQPGDEDLNIE